MTEELPITATENNYDDNSNRNEAQEFVDATSLSEEDVPLAERKVQIS